MILPPRHCDYGPISWSVRRGADQEIGTFWSAKASDYLRCYFHAAALAGFDLRTVAAWVSGADPHVPEQILAATGARQWALTLAELRSEAHKTTATVRMVMSRALARRDAKTRTVSLILDTTTANIAMYAITAYASDREAHVREVEQVGEAFPKDSYGKRNRQAIAARETRIAERLRAVERAYRIAIERDREVTPEIGPAPSSAEPVADREIELE
jgi:hypothetical protein